ncbi:MAG: fumarylacetoacetate hydrolase family protein [Paracoccaceae bacterium]
MAYVFPPAAQPSVAVNGSDKRFPVRRIFCVGQNYAAHVLEMGGDISKPPVFFSKPGDAVVKNGSNIPYPLSTSDLHYEAELVVGIGKAGVNIAEADAASHIWGYGVGIDLTRRDLQYAAREIGMPWDMAKGFDRSAPCGDLHAVADTGILDAGHIRLSVNGEVRQQSDISDMIWSVPAIISKLSDFQALAAGDLIYTGTPSGVGQIVAGDRIDVDIQGLSRLSVTIT